MVLKPYGDAVDVKAGAGAFGGDRLVWVVNTHSAAAKVTIANATPAIIFIPAGEGLLIEKEPGAAVDAATAGANVWATAVAYAN